MKSTEFVKKLKDIALNYKTLYVMGCFGAPMTPANKIRYTSNNAYNMRADRAAMIRAAGADTFGFDCVCLIKGILWGWSGKKNSIYGGAVYGSNGVPDINDTQLFARCSSQSSDFCNILPGEAVWLPGHIGVYIGDGLAVECTPAWKNDVQITACNCDKAGYHRRNWQKRVNRIMKTIPIAESLAQEVLAGKWGNGNVRKERLELVGYDYRIVQDKVNEIVKK